MKKILSITCVFFIALTNLAYSQIDTVSFNPEENNFNTDMLSELHSEITDSVYGVVHSLLIVRNGDLVFEEYYNGYSRQELQSLYSITKTISSALIGIAIDQGKIDGVDDYMLDFFPEYTDIENNNAYKQAITLKHLLTMTSGYDGSMSSIGSTRTQQYLNAPVPNQPGEVWSYCDKCVKLLGGIIQNKAGESAEDFANKYLFTPLGISNWYWSTYEEDEGPDLPNTSSGLKLRPLDMARFGQLYLQKGAWDGKQIISEEWINKSVDVQVDYAKEDRSYGYLLYQFVDTSSVSQMLREKDAFFAVGAHQKRIYVIPHLECVVVITGYYPDPKAILKEVLKTMNDGTITSTVSPKANAESYSFSSFENYPNPFKHSTTIKYNLSKSNNVVLKICNRYGQEIETLVNDFQIAGKHEITWHSKGLSSGIYYCKLQADEFSETKKLILY